MISTLTFNASQTLHKVNFTGKCYNFLFKESRRMKSFHACSLIHVDVYVAVANMPSYTALLHKQTPCIIFMLQGRGPRKNDYITPCTRVCVNLSKYLDCKNNTVMIFTGFSVILHGAKNHIQSKKIWYRRMNITTSLEKLMEEVGLGQVGRWGHFSIYHKFKPPQICYQVGCCRRGTTLFED